jgi:hypothetical protein
MINFFLLNLEIVECLNVLGLIETNELSIEKLMNVTNETFELLIFIINDLLKMIYSKSDSNITSNRHHFMEDDFHILDPVLLQKSLANPYPAFNQTDGRKKYLDDFNRRISILDDPIYIREYRNILESKCESLIPPDKARLITSINDNSEYLTDIQFNNKKYYKSDVIKLLEVHLEKLIENVDMKNKVLESVNL